MEWACSARERRSPSFSNGISSLWWRIMNEAWFTKCSHSIEVADFLLLLLVNAILLCEIVHWWWKIHFCEWSRQIRFDELMDVCIGICLLCRRVVSYRGKECTWSYVTGMHQYALRVIICYEFLFALVAWKACSIGGGCIKMQKSFGWGGLWIPL